MSISDLQGGEKVWKSKPQCPPQVYTGGKKGNVQKVIIYERDTHSRGVFLVHLGCCELLETTWVSRRGNKRLQALMKANITTRHKLWK